MNVQFQIVCAAVNQNAEWSYDAMTNLSFLLLLKSMKFLGTCAVLEFPFRKTMFYLDGTHR